MKIFYTTFILLFIHISCLCDYEGKSSQSFCGKRKVDYEEVPTEFRDLYSQYKCCYIYIYFGGEKSEGCVTTSPTMIKDIPTCASYYQNPNTNSNQDGSDDDSNLKNYEKYLLSKIYKILLFSLLLY